MNFSLFKRIADEVLRGEQVSQTAISGLNTKTFVDEGRKIVAIQQNPRTGSEWARLVQQGHKVVQFKDVVTNKYIGVVVDGVVRKYPFGEHHVKGQTHVQHRRNR